VGADVYIDGSSVEAIDGSVTRRLNGPSQAECTIPMHLASGDVGSKGKFVLDGKNALHGRCTFLDVAAGEDTGYAKYVFTDATEIWDKRPARDGPNGTDPGDFSKPLFFEEILYGPQIMEEILEQSINGTPPTLGEGPMEILLGAFATGGPSLEGAPTDWPMTIAEIATLLVSTGQVDILAVPIDDGTNTCRVDVFNGNYGNDLTGDVILEFGMGAYNISSLRWTKDLADVVNKLWYYLGPRVETPEDPAGDQHWRANVQGFDPGLPDPPKSAVLALRDQSRVDYLVRMMIQIFDGRGDEATVGRQLYRWQWLAEQWLRAMPRELIHVTPIRGLPYDDYGEGDLITVRADGAVKGGFSGAQRIYEFTASWGGDSVIAVSELQVSAGNEGFS